MAGRKRRKYCVYTLDANRMADMYRAQDGCFDLNAAYIRSAIVQADDNMYSDSALFDQVLFALDGIMDREAQSRDVTSHLVYLLFENGIRDEAKAKALFDDGFKIRFEGQKEMRSFCSFDKSASMSRESTISFIDEAIFDEVDRRIGLDIDFTTIPLTPSKYYAYRGLYMTEGIPVTLPELRLDEETVLVLPDKKLKLKNVSQIKADLSKLEETGKIEISEENTHPKEGKLSVTPYDGEGFVSPDYAALIRSALFYPKDTKPTSFQIRMPFAKGMLHEVDFKVFLAREFDLSEEEVSELGIEDYFGITRSLRDVEIVLNASMFKCGKWLKDYDPAWEMDGDPLKYYFNKMWKYDHCLYVVNTNTSIRDTGKIKFNYQFLNTLDIDRDAFDGLVSEYSDDIQAARVDAEAARRALLGSDLLSEGDPEDIDSSCLREMSPWEYAVSVNLAFMNDEKTKKELKKLEDSQIANIIRGRITVDGLMRYLSGDLLAMLIDIAKGCGFKGTKAIKFLQGETLHANKFYIPNIKQYGIEKGHFYGVLRSPHLSRNEQCALRPYTSRIYNRYFKHLDGVIMVSNLSTVPAALAGADYDGDLVKIVQDETINKAILRGVFEAAPRKGSDEPEYIRYRRKLPIAVINAPAGATDIKVGRHISIEHAKASFSSRVGMISNLAITIGELEYSGAKIPAGTTALCTIATGLELDAVKTGVRPDLTYLQKIIEEGQTGLQFIDTLKQYRAFVSEHPQKAIYGAVEDDEYRAFYKTKTNGKKENVPVFAVKGDVEVNIERLPALFVEALIRKRSARRGAFKGIPTLQFLFEYDKDWRANAREDKRKDELSAIIDDYKKKRSEGFVAADKTQKQDAKLATISGCIYTLLSMEYNIMSDRLFHTGAEVKELFDKAASELSPCFKNPDEVAGALAEMRKLQWQFVQTYEARQEVLAQILDVSKLSEEVRELLCDTYDNGYQILNYFLQYVQVLKEKEEAKKELDGSGTAWKRNYTEEKYLEKVLELFEGDVEQAIECTAALDETRVFLWNIFDTEDMAKVIDDGIIRRQINAE